VRTKLDIYVIIGQDYKEQFFIVALHDFEVSAAYLAGTDGIISDSLSRWHLYKNHPRKQVNHMAKTKSAKVTYV
jgi:hypothetical protein